MESNKERRQGKQTKYGERGNECISSLFLSSDEVRSVNASSSNVKNKSDHTHCGASTHLNAPPPVIHRKVYSFSAASIHPEISSGERKKKHIWCDAIFFFVIIWIKKLKKNEQGQSSYWPWGIWRSRFPASLHRCAICSSFAPDVGWKNSFFRVKMRPSDKNRTMG